MMYVNIGLAVCALGSGLIAAWYWYQSSAIQPDPGWTTQNPEPVDQELRQIAWNTAMLDAMTKSAGLNKVAALWTAVSAGLGGMASIVGSLA
jgi:hypothetical protein